MNDLERRVKTALDADAAKAPRVSQPPDKLRRRVRRRQVGRSALVTLTVSAVALVSFAGFRAIEQSSDDDRIAVDDPWAGYEVFERTAEVGNFRITSPSNWYLIRPVPTPGCLANFDCDAYPALQLSNFDPGLSRTACDAPIPRDGAVLAIQADVQRDPEAVAGDPPFPVPFDPDTQVTDGSCGAGRYLHFRLWNLPYSAWIGTGKEVDPDDLDQLIRSFDGMSALRSSRGSLGGDSTRAAYVVAGGENAAGSWRLELRPSVTDTTSSDIELALVGPDGGPVIEGFDVPDVPIEQGGGDPTFGAVTKAAETVELRSENGSEEATIVPLPPTLPYDLDLFFGVHEGDVPARATALDAVGDLLGTASALDAADVNADGNYVIARFDAFGSPYELSVSRGAPGCGISLRNIETGISGGSNCGGLAGSFGSLPPEAFFYGPLKKRAVTVEVVTRDGRQYPAVAVGSTPDGRSYFVVAVEGSGPGSLRTLDAQGNVVRTSRQFWRDQGQIIDSAWSPQP